MRKGVRRRKKDTTERRKIGRKYQIEPNQQVLGV
jgi:hypothetical protein